MSPAGWASGVRSRVGVLQYVILTSVPVALVIKREEKNKRIWDLREERHKGVEKGDKERAGYTHTFEGELFRCVPEGELLGASTASRGNHPEDPLLLLLASMCSTPGAPAVLSCRVHGALRATTHLDAMLLVCPGLCDLGPVPCSACVPAPPSRHDALWCVRRAVLDPLVG